MRRWLAASVVFACLMPARAEAQRIERLVEEVALAADGSARVTVDFDWPSAVASRILLPVASADVSDIRVEGRSGTATVVQDRTGRPRLAIDRGKSAPVDARLRVTFTLAKFFDPEQAPLAHEIRRVRYEFANTTDLPIGVFRGVLVLPPETIVASVGELTPEAPESAVDSPYTLGRRDGNRTIALDVAPLGSGDVAGLTISIKPDSVPVALLAFLVIVALGYLYRFRDLVRHNVPPSPDIIG